MNPLKRIVSGLGLGAESFSTLANPSDSLRTAFTGGTTASGQTVSVRNSLTLIPVYSAVSQIAGDLGSLPLIVYRRRPDDSRERAGNHRAWKLLHDLPNPEMAADEVWEMVCAHLNLWGNAFIWKRRDSLGIVQELWPLSPGRVQVNRRKSDGLRQFVVDGKTENPFTEADILHIRGMSLDGTVGLSPIQEARESLGVMKAQGDFQGRFLRADGKPGVLLMHPNRVSDDAAERLERSFDAAKPGSTKLLEEGMTAEKWTMPLEDAQFLESMQFSDLRVAQLFKLPPRRLGAKSGDSLTYSTTESEGRDYVTYTLRRWMGRIENSIRRDASIFTQGDRFFCEFLADALMRGDTKSRYEAYEIGIRAGVIEPAEARRWENLPPAENRPPDPAP